ncbi:lipopolysaccharide biosynthesis protein [Vibrio splendidus]|uniref:lipopolysaccharide biosynthesis protein n=1 Tax=Vibrio splendidus TaxID=29497 RepID=UPI00352E58C1
MVKWSNVLILFRASIIGQALPLILLPTLVSLYSAEDFGQLGFVIAVYTVLSIIFTLRLDQAIVVQETNDLANEIINTVLLLSAVFSFILLIILLLLSMEFVYVDDNLLVLCVTVYLSNLWAITNSINQYLIREEMYKVVASAKVLLACTILAFQFIFYYLDVQPGLLAAQVIGMTLVTIYLFLKISKYTEYHFAFVRVESIQKLLKVNKNFCLYMMPNSLMNSISINSPQILLSYFFSAHATGIYVLANRFVGAPLGMITSSISQVIYSSTSKLKLKGELTSTMIDSFIKRQVLIGIAPFSALGLYSLDFSEWFLGDDWTEVALIVQFMAPWLFMLFINTPITVLVNVYQKQKEYLLFEMVTLLLRVSSIYYGYYKCPEDFMYSIKLFASVSFVMNVLLFIYIRFSVVKRNCED